MADTAAPAQARIGGIDVPARLQQALALLFPSNLAAKAVLFAVVLALLPTGEAPRIWELPHILLLGLVISYGVFGQRNADADADVPAAKIVHNDDDHEDDSLESYVSQLMQGPLVFEPNGGDGESSNGAVTKDDGGVQAWSSQYYPDDPLVLVTGDKGDASEKPLLLPVRKLKPAAGEESPTTGGNLSDDGIDEETDFILPKDELYGGARERAMPSPSSVLDAGMTLSPSSPPPPPPPAKFVPGGRGLGKAKARSFNEYGAGAPSMSWRAGSRSGGDGKHRFRSNSASQATRGSAFAGYDSVAPFDDEVPADDEELDEVAAASDSSFGSDGMATDGDDGDGNEEDGYEEEEAGSCDEELFDLATRPGLEATEEDEVDRKADEFIAKFREQIRMQRAGQGRS